MYSITFLLAGLLMFILGSVMGSFYNVLVMRLPKNKDVVKSRSCCDSCNTTLKWYDMFPVISYVILGGKCRYCKAKIPPNHFIMEIAAGGLFLLDFILFFGDGNWLLVLYYAVFWSFLLIVSAMDIREHVVMDILIIIFALIVGVLRYIIYGHVVNIILGVATGFAFYFIIYIFARLLLKKEGLGQGDITTLMGIGAFFSPLETIIVGFLAFYVALIIIIIVNIKTIVLRLKYKACKSSYVNQDNTTDKNIKFITRIPFAPSLCIAAFIISIYGQKIIEYIKQYY